MAWKVATRHDHRVIYNSMQWMCDTGEYVSLDIHHLENNNLELFINCFGGRDMSHVYIISTDLTTEWYPKGKELDYWKKDIKTREKWACRVADDVCRRFCREDKVK